MAVRPLHRCLLVVAVTCFSTAGCGTRYLNGCGPSGRIVHAAVRPPGSGAVVVDFGDAYLLSADGTLTRLQLTGDSCFATAPDGTIWSYDFVDGTLIATLPGSGAKAFPFQPERDFDCASLAIEESGDLLLLSANWGTPAGLWRIPNPLVSR